MKNRRMIMYVAIIALILVVFGVGYLVYVNVGWRAGGLQEYTPEAEIPDEELLRTVINLYFLDVATGELGQDARIIESSELVHNPYQRIIELLLMGPSDETRARIIPEETSLLGVELKGNIVHLDLSEDFVRDQNLGEEQEKKIVRSIVNTLTELIEVDGVKINIEGNEAAGFPDGIVSFENPFMRGI